jgi:Uma2 family endonuclease
MSVGAVIFENLVRIPSDVFDLPRFREWAHSDEFPQTGKISFIEGEIEIDMSPEELSSHNRVKRDLSTDLNVFVRKTDMGELLVDGAFLVNEAANLATEPDLMFCAWATLRMGRVEFAPAVKGSTRLVEVRGSPDLVCEIVSQGSIRKDTVRLRKAYFEAGVLEYWLIDARGKILDFHILTRGKKAYVAAKPDADGFRRSPVLRRSFRMVRRKNRVGGACYRLLSR